MDGYMSELISNFSRAVLIVSIASVIGSWLRFLVISYFERQGFSKHLGILYVNILSAFLLGLVVALRSRCEGEICMPSLYLALEVGFLGSVSTFSAFVLEIIELISKSFWRKLIQFIFYSLFGGLIASAVGYSLGYA